MILFEYLQMLSSPSQLHQFSGFSYPGKEGFVQFVDVRETADMTFVVIIAWLIDIQVADSYTCTIDKSIYVI